MLAATMKLLLAAALGGALAAGARAADDKTDPAHLAGVMAAAKLELGDLLLAGGIDAAGTDAALAFYARVSASAAPGAIVAVMPPSSFATGARARPDPDRALTLYADALSAGQTDALLRLGDLYSDGKAITADLAKAFDYYQRAAAAGSTTAELRVGQMYALGRGTPQDVNKGRAIVSITKAM